jgi:integrase
MMTDFELKRPRGRPEGSTLGGVTRTLTKDELRRFFAAATKAGRKFDLMFALIFHFALRAGEAAVIRLDDFKSENRGDGNLLVLTIKALKGGATSKPEVPEAIERKLKAWQKERAKLKGVEGNPFLFPHRLRTRSGSMTTEAVKAAFRMVAREAKIEVHHSVHDLRHTKATELAFAGLPTVKIASWLRHRSPSSSDRYVHVVEMEKLSHQLAASAEEFLK